MSITIEIYNPTTSTTYDITSNTLKIDSSEKLGAENNTFRLSCFDIALVHKYNTITITINSVVRFRGIIVNQFDSSENGIKYTELECYDYSFLLNNRIIAEVYESDTIDTILKDIISKCTSELTTTNVSSSSVTIDKLKFDYIAGLEAIKKLFEHTYNYYWYVDASKDVHMFYNYETIGDAIDKSKILY
jgi:hypothetical protein